MTNKRFPIAKVVGFLAFTSLALLSLPAQAIPNATVVVVNGGTVIRSTSVASVAVVTGTDRHKSYIECYFETDTGQVGLHLVSKDQRRIEALYQQIVTSSTGIGFQITAYVSSTYQTDGYVANLESDLVYLLLGS